MNGYRILLVDDGTFMRMAATQMLVDTEFQVVGVASNGKEALDRYRTLWPDVVLLDVVMPEMDGQQALAGIRQLDPKARVVMANSLGEESRLEDVMAAGAKDYLVKPFDQERLLQALRRAILS